MTGMAGAVLSGWLIVPSAVNRQLKRAVAVQLQATLPHLQLTLRNTRYDPQVGLILEGVEIKPRGDRSGRRTARIAELICRTKVDLQQLLSRPVQFEELIVNGAELWCAPDATGQWNIQSLVGTSRASLNCPRVHVIDGRVRIFSDQEYRYPLLDLDDVDLLIESRDAENKLLSSLHATGAQLRGIKLTAEYDRASRKWRSRFAVDQLRLDGHQLVDASERLAKRWSAWMGWTGVLRMEGSLTGTGTTVAEQQLKVELSEGAYDSPRLPRPLRNMSGRLRWDDGLLTVDELRYMVGASPFSMAGLVRFSPQGELASIEAQLGSDRMIFEEDWADYLPTRLRELWLRWRPAGCISVRGRVQYAEGVWQPALAVRCHDVSVQCAKFPYPIRQIAGDVLVDGERIASERLAGFAGEVPVTAAFATTLRKKAPPVGICELQTAGPIPIDDRLFAALSPLGSSPTRLQTFVEELRPRGGLELRSGRWDLLPNGHVAQRLQLQVSDGSLQWTGFPYPITRIAGRIEIDGQRLELVNLQGQNANAMVTCQGFWQLGSGGDPFDLVFLAQALPLDEQLRACLDPESQQRWDAFRPNGVVENLAVQFRRGSPNAQVELTVHAEQAIQGTHPTHHLQVRPQTLPYQWEIERGQVHYEHGRVRIEGLRARHGQSLIVANGHCERDLSGTWLLQFELGVDSRLRLDAELLDALPASVRAPLYPLRLTEPFGVYGTTQWALPTTERSPAEWAYDLTLLFEGNGLGDSGLVHEIRGRVTAQGKRSTDGMQLRGELDLDSMFVKDIQVTRVRGPILVSNGQAFVGQSAPLAEGPRKSVVGSLFGGSIVLDGSMELASGDFDGSLRLMNAQLGEALADLGHPDPSHQGVVTSQVDFQGQLGNLWVLRGTGQATLRDARLYQLPLLIRMMNQLRISPSPDAAFTSGDARFRIEADTMQVQSLQLSGGLVSLDGAGTVSLQHELDLRFRTIVNPTSPWNRVTRNLRETPYNLLMLEVSGTIDEPQVQRMGMREVNRWGSRATERFSRLPELFRDRRQGATSPADPAAGAVLR